jgi:hypothetical protein
MHRHTGVICACNIAQDFCYGLASSRESGQGCNTPLLQTLPLATGMSVLPHYFRGLNRQTFIFVKDPHVTHFSPRMDTARSSPA